MPHRWAAGGGGRARLGHDSESRRPPVGQGARRPHARAAAAAAIIRRDARLRGSDDGFTDSDLLVAGRGPTGKCAGEMFWAYAQGMMGLDGSELQVHPSRPHGPQPQPLRRRRPGGAAAITREKQY